MFNSNSGCNFLKEQASCAISGFKPLKMEFTKLVYEPACQKGVLLPIWKLTLKFPIAQLMIICLGKTWFDRALSAGFSFTGVGGNFLLKASSARMGGAPGGKDSYRPIYPLSTPSSPSNTICGKKTNTTISEVNVKFSKLPFFYNLWEPYLTSSFVPLAISLLWQSVIGFQLLYVFNLVKWANFFSSCFQNHSEI